MEELMAATKSLEKSILNGFKKVNESIGNIELYTKKAFNEIEQIKQELNYFQK